MQKQRFILMAVIAWRYHIQKKKKKDYTNERIEKWKEVAEKEGKVKSSFEFMTEETETFECNVFAEQEQMSMVNDVTGIKTHSGAEARTGEAMEIGSSRMA